MTEYIAWNGETYQGQPPDSWVEAADGRWWPVESLRRPAPPDPRRPPPTAQRSPAAIPPTLAQPTAEQPRQNRTRGIVIGVIAMTVAIGAVALAATSNNDQPQTTQTSSSPSGPLATAASRFETEGCNHIYLRGQDTLSAFIDPHEAECIAVTAWLFDRVGLDEIHDIYDRPNEGLWLYYTTDDYEVIVGHQTTERSLSVEPRP